MAIDVLDSAHENCYDVPVLITGDGDFVPLARRATSLNRQVLVAHFEFDQWTDKNQITHRPEERSGNRIYFSESPRGSTGRRQRVTIMNRLWKFRRTGIFGYPVASIREVSGISKTVAQNPRTR